MYTSKQLRQQVTWFLLLTFAITYGLALVTYLKGGLDSFPLPAVSMFVPMLTAFFVQKRIAGGPIFKGDALGFQLGRKRFLLIAPLLFGLLIVATYVLSTMFEPSLLVNQAELVERTREKIVLFEGWSPSAQLIAGLFVDVVLGSILMLPLFLGEEIGWRAFLVPKLEELMGKPALIAGGVIWAMWHTPGILMGHNYPEHPLVGLLLWIPLCICMGIILQYFYQRSGSVFAVAFCHGVLNKISAGAMALFLKDPDTLLFGPTGVVGLLVMGPVAIGLYRRYTVHTSSRHWAWKRGGTDVASPAAQE